MNLRSARSRLAALALALLFCGCDPWRTGPSGAETVRDHFNASWEAEGAPFRFPVTSPVNLSIYNRTLLGTPASTTANDALQAKAIAMIRSAELSMKGRTGEVKIREIRSWPAAGPGVREIWVLEDPPAPRMIAYVITFTPGAAGTEIGLKGPFQ